MINAQNEMLCVVYKTLGLLNILYEFIVLRKIHCIFYSQLLI